ncbi:MAG TPA: TIM barrel protein [Chthoniobacterales bacterium]
MSAISQAVAWWCFVPARLSPESFVRAVSKAGYIGCELVPPEHWPLVTDHGLTITAVAGHKSLEIGLNRRSEHDRIEQEILENIDHAQRLNIRYLICFSGNRNGVDDAQGAEVTAEGLARVAAAAEAAGVNLVLELLNSKVDHPGYQADHTGWGVDVCRAVGSPNIKLLYDIYHMQIMEGDVIRTIRTARPYIGHYHTAGNPGRNDLDEEQELNYPSILTAIKDTGHTGYVTHEFLPKGDPIASLENTYRKCSESL